MRLFYTFLLFMFSQNACAAQDTMFSMCSDMSNMESEIKKICKKTTGQQCLDIVKNSDHASDGLLLSLGSYLYGSEKKHKDLKSSVLIFKKLADKGNNYAQYIMGKLYLKGEGIKHDPNKAILYFDQASVSLAPAFLADLGYIYINGYDLPQDVKKGYKYYKEAAEKGNIDAQHSLGYLYYKGLGVPQNYVESFAWFSIAAKQNYKASIDMLGDFDVLLDKVERDDAKDLSQKYYNLYVEKK